MNKKDSLLVATIKRLIPVTVKKSLRRQHRRYTFARAMKRYMTTRGVEDVTNDLLGELIYGWGNEGWSAKEEYIKEILRHAYDGTGPILECGSGLSTILCGRVADKVGREIWTLEHMPFYADLVNRTLKRYRIKAVRFHVKDLKDYGSFSWYDPPLEKMPRDFSMVVCDGPPGETPGGRYGFLPVMKEHLESGCVILLDDANRSSEAEILSLWAEQMGTKQRIIGQGKQHGIVVVP